jgi:TRAP-type C4-dicarboxylate transport system substrate-binding protein
MRGTIWTAAIAVAASAAFGAPAGADEVVLKFATLDSPHAHLNANIHHPWAKKLTEDGKGVLKIDVRDGPAVANHGNVYSRVVDDVVQMGWGLPTYAGGKFKLIEVVGLPFIGEWSEAASTALWRLYKSGALDSEFDEVMPLKLIVFPQSGMQYRAEPKTLDNLDGLKIIASNKMTSQMVGAMGGAALSFRVNEMYEALQRGLADGVMIGWTAFQPFKLAEVTRYHVEITLGGSPGYVFMNRKKFAGLPEPARKLIEANSGERASRDFGKFWDGIHKFTAQQVRKLDSHTVVTAKPELVAKWRARISPLTEKWIAETPGGDKVFATYKKLLADIAAGS